MDDKKYEFLPDDFEFIGDKQNINIDEVAPARPANTPAIIIERIILRVTFIPAY